MYHSIRSVDFHLRNNTEVVLSRKEWADIRKELEEAQNSIDNPERFKLLCTTNHACKSKGIKKQCTYRCIYAEPKGKQDKA